jgi:hypothetical protein
VSSAKQMEESQTSSSPLKPMVSARKVTLFRREIKEWISPPAIEILIGAAEVIAEGSFDTSETDNPLFLGSILIKVDLETCGAYIQDPLDAAAARRLAQMILSDQIAREVLTELALREAERSAGCALFELQTEIDASHKGNELSICIELEGLVRPR